jgi:hypothetical protein
MVAYDHTSADHPHGMHKGPAAQATPRRHRPRHRRSDRGIHEHLDHQFDDYHDEIGTGENHLRRRSGQGTALDVFEVEPPHNSPLLDLPNVVVSPHIAGLSTASVDEMSRRVTASVIDVLEGRVPAGLANPAILATSGTKSTKSTNDERLHT